MNHFFSHGLGAALLALSMATPAASLDTELLVNGNAEAGTTAGWSSTGMDAIGNAVAGTAGLPPGTSLGHFVFSGGTGAASGQALTQSVDVQSLATAIDAGDISSRFSVLAQSRSLDHASGTLRFLGAGMQQLAVFAFDDPVSSAFNWALYGDTRIVPTGTRSIEIFLLTTRSTGVSSDAYFDNTSLVLTSAVPEPAAAWLLLAALPLLVLRWRMPLAAR